MLHLADKVESAQLEAEKLTTRTRSNETDWYQKKSKESHKSNETSKGLITLQNQ